MSSEFDNEPRRRSLDDYLIIAKRGRWWILGSAFLAWAIALGVSWGIPLRYKSETVILVEQPKVPSQYVTPNVAVDLQTRLQSLSEQILSRTRLLRIVADLHLYKQMPTQDPEMIVQRMRQDIKLDLVNSGPNELTGFKITFSASDPHVAQEVTGRLSSLFIDENLRKQQQLSEDTTSFLESELEGARRDLEQQEAQLRDYRTRFLGALPEQLQGNMQILGGLQTRLDGTNESLSHAEQQKVYLTSLLQQYRSPQRTANSETPARASLDQQLDRLRAQLADASARYTPKHPDVVHLKEQIVVLENLKRAPQEKAPASNTEQSAASDPIDSPAAQLAGQLKVTEAEIATRKKEAADLEHQISEYQVRLNLTPIREQQLSALTRNYNQSRNNYESLLAKKLQSQIATNLEKRQQGEQFRILDPPSFPQKPYFPERWKFALGGLGAGLALGVGFVAAMEISNSRIHSERDLLDFGYAVLASIPPLRTAREQNAAARNRWVELALTSVMLTVIPVLTIVTFWKG